MPPAANAANAALPASDAPSDAEEAARAAREARHTDSLPRRLVALVSAAFSSWLDDYAPSMGAALAYYTLFSIAPMLLIVISVAGMVFGEEAARGEIFEQLIGLMGAEGAAAVQSLLESLRRPTEGLTGTLIGGVVLLIGATTVFGELQDAMDRIWRAPTRDGRKGGLSGLWSLLHTRLLSFGMVLAIGFLLMVSLVLSAALAAMSRQWGALFGSSEAVAQLVNAGVSFLVTTLAFAMIYKFIPRVHVAWKDVWIGALVTSALFTLGKLLIGLYIGKSGVVSGFGAASSIVVLLVWVYYSAQIFLLGAEFTWVYAHTFGSRRERPRPPAGQRLAATADDSGPERQSPAPRRSDPPG
jgi:membrane protein